MSGVVLLLTFLYTFFCDFTIFYIMHFCFRIITVHSEGIQTSFMFANYFYCLCNGVIFSFAFVYCCLYIYKCENRSIENLSASFGTFLVVIHVCIWEGQTKKTLARYTAETADKIAPRTAEMANSGNHVGPYSGVM
jgi:hypothetical protein